MGDVYSLVPDHVRLKLGSQSKVCLVNGKELFRKMRDEKFMIMACNTRIKHAIPGIMKAAEELDALVAFELAMSEGHVDGGYTGMPPQVYFETLVDYAERTGFTKPFIIHGDHITIKDASEASINKGRILIDAELEAGYTSFAIDASFNELHDNVRITKDLAKKIVDAGLGLEVEVGEIKSVGSEGEITTVAEAQEFVEALVDHNINPNLLAINNGSKHGNYLPGEEVHIDLDRTKEVHTAISKHGVDIAQHGITGTPLHLMYKFVDCGIKKGNVGTLWQNIGHEHLPDDLMNRMKQWAQDQGKNIKMATKPFKEEIDNIPDANRQALEDHAYREAKEFFKAFQAVGSASKLADKI
ncbi:MAG: fructose-bisphosphate aldolase [Phycisphaerae bacterium SM23_30]|nr:MAG: fructose-bisphosphate aldolase [Phycisphaerae bacterium SM23_30]